MTLEASLNALAPPMFDGINYRVWVVCMEAYLDASDLWEAVREEYEVPPLSENRTMARIKLHNERRIVQKIFITVLEKFETTISSLENSKDMPSITLAELLNALQAQEQRRLMRQEESVEGAFQAISQYKKEMQRNNNSSNNTQKFPPCPYCKKSNHPQKKVLMEDGWLFKELDKIVTSKVRIGNGAYLVVKGKGTMAIEGHTGLKLISNGFYVPEINQNVLSVDQLLEKGYKVLFEENHCMIADAQGREVFIVQMKSKSFALDLMQEEQAAIRKEESNTMLWHRRLGHFHHTALLFMKKNDLGEGLPELEVKPSTYVACQYGKQTRLLFPPNKAWRATHKLQLVHTDVGGPQRTPSLNDIADIFWKFKAWAKNQSIKHQLTTPYTP
ncbi:hypothetical protein CK203_040735 [Vitis vinifera]|uniref:GAG-pre-integrase domain-containing protein n=1 Tax=Vitis vinifera TaxID=29760 RepID=A0A438HFA0_VITVI|nr:hypothetical protein CK203_040735 [Vitis vinifera]